MPITTNGALYAIQLHPTDGDKGYHPYLIVVKKNGVYVQGHMEKLIHLSLHHQPDQNDASLSQCHLTIPKEIEPSVVKNGFNSREYFKWKRKCGIDNQFHRASLLIFPVMYAQSAYASIEPSEISVEMVSLEESAVIVGFWYTGNSVATCRAYLNSFGKALYVNKLPNDEVFGINVVHEKRRDYGTFQMGECHGTFTVTSCGNRVFDDKITIHVGPFGANCFGLLHGNPKAKNTG